MSAASAPILRQYMTETRIKESLSLMRRSSSIKRCVSRHTRNLLREYVKLGHLAQAVPTRCVSDVVVDMNHGERRLYDDIDDFVRECYGTHKVLTARRLGS